MLELPSVTLVAVACTKVGETIEALRLSKKKINFAEAILITHEVHDLSADGITVININKLNYKEYNYFVLFLLQNYIKTKHCLLVQNDGYVQRPEQWRPDFLRYDYIGAPWPANTHFTPEGRNVRVGNGGFSLRSKTLLQAPQKLRLEFTDKDTGYFHEDGFISVYFRDALENYGIRYAPVTVASHFSREVWCHDSALAPFGFHNKTHKHRLLGIKNALRQWNIPI